MHKNFVEFGCKRVMGTKRLLPPVENESLLVREKCARNVLECDSNVNENGGSMQLLKAIYVQNERSLDADNVTEQDAELQDYPSMRGNADNVCFALGDRFEKLSEDIRLFFVEKKGHASTNDVLIKFKALFFFI